LIGTSSDASIWQVQEGHAQFQPRAFVLSSTLPSPARLPSSLLRNFPCFSPVLINTCNSFQLGIGKFSSCPCATHYPLHIGLPHPLPSPLLPPTRRSLGGPLTRFRPLPPSTRNTQRHKRGNATDVYNSCYCSEGHVRSPRQEVVRLYLISTIVQASFSFVTMRVIHLVFRSTRMAF